MAAVLPGDGAGLVAGVGCGRRMAGPVVAGLEAPVPAAGQVLPAGTTAGQTLQVAEHALAQLKKLKKKSAIETSFDLRFK